MTNTNDPHSVAVAKAAVQQQALTGEVPAGWTMHSTEFAAFPAVATDQNAMTVRCRSLDSAVEVAGSWAGGGNAGLRHVYATPWVTMPVAGSGPAVEVTYQVVLASALVPVGKLPRSRYQLPEHLAELDFTDRKEAVEAACGAAQLWAGEVGIATMFDGKLIAYGFSMTDYHPDDRDTLGTIARDLKIEVHPDVEPADRWAVRPGGLRDGQPS